MIVFAGRPGAVRRSGSSRIDCTCCHSSTDTIRCPSEASATMSPRCAPSPRSEARGAPCAPTRDPIGRHVESGYPPRRTTWLHQQVSPRRRRVGTPAPEPAPLPGSRPRRLVNPAEAASPGPRRPGHVCIPPPRDTGRSTPNRSATSSPPFSVHPSCVASRAPPRAPTCGATRTLRPLRASERA